MPVNRRAAIVSVPIPRPAEVLDPVGIFPPKCPELAY